MKRFCNLRILILLICLLTGLFTTKAELTIEQCVEKSRQNYPIIKKYGLLEAFREIDLSEINKSWLPKMEMYGRITGQNVVPSYPEALSRVLQQMGQDVKGLSRIQYKVGVDINQTIWDGGLSKANRELIKMKEEVQATGLDVELYNVRERVENIFFAILLLDQQIEQNEITANLLDANLEKLRSMFKNGVAMQSDCDMVEAQLLTIRQNIQTARYDRDGLVRTMELFVGESLEGMVFSTPAKVLIEGAYSERPELTLFDQRVRFNTLSDKFTETTLMPKIGFFAQAYYGYPGFDYFKSMMRRTLSFNIMAGVNVSWNIDSFYHKRNRLHRTILNNEEIENDRELFLFNTRVASERHRFAIEGLKKTIAEDDRIIELRRRVRAAAESQLANGVIDATALLSKISDENIAALTARLHHLEYLQEIYKLKYILNK